MTIETVNAEKEYLKDVAAVSKVGYSDACLRPSIDIPRAPPSTPVRKSFFDPAEKFRHASKVNYAQVPCLIPHIIPPLKTASGLLQRTILAKESEVRYLPKGSCSVLNPQSLLNDMVPCTSVSKSSKNQLNAQKNKQDRVAFNNYEKDAAHALLGLKDCSTKVANMTNNWRDTSNIPLCDFIAVQKKCELMMDKINTLKSAKINQRNHTRKDLKLSDIVNSFDESKINSSATDLFRTRSKSLTSKSSSVISLTRSNAENKQNKRSCSCSFSEISSLSSNGFSTMLSSSQQPENLLSIDNFSDENKKTDSVLIEERYHIEYSKQKISKNGKSSKSGKNRNAHMRCLHCLATDTPEWRKGPKGPATLCNACGLFFKKLLRKFGSYEAKLLMHHRQAANPNDRKVPRNVDL